MLYEKGLGNITKEEKAKASALGFLNGIDSMAEEERAKARALGFRNSICSMAEEEMARARALGFRYGLGKRTEEEKAKDVGKKRGALSAEHQAKISVAKKPVCDFDGCITVSAKRG